MSMRLERDVAELQKRVEYQEKQIRDIEIVLLKLMQDKTTEAPSKRPYNRKPHG